MEPKLIYTGHGDAFYHVPPRDLTEADFAERAQQWQEFGITEDLLISSGLYKKPDNENTPAKKNKREKESE